MGDEHSIKNERRAVMFTVIATAFVTTFSASSLNIAIPVIGREFHSPATHLSWIVTTYFLFTVALSVPFGRLADITGKRRLFILGILVFGAMSGVNAVSTSLQMVILFRALQGVGAAMVFATSTAIIADVFPARMRGRMLGISVAFTYTGLSAGPVLGGLLTHYLDWRYTFALSCAVALVAFAIAAAKLPKRLAAAAVKKGAASSRMDPPGIALYIASTSVLMYGLTIFTQNAASYFITGAGIALLVVFVNFELKAEHPVIEIRLFKSANFLLSNLAALFNYGATFALSYLLSIYLQMVKGYGADLSGLILIVQPVCQAILSPLAGKLSDRHSPYRIASLGMGVCAASLVLFIFMDAATPVWGILLDLVAIGVGVAFFSSPNTNAIMSCVDARDYGVASSLTSTMRTMGQIVSMAIITIILNTVLGATPIDEAAESALLSSMHTGFVIFAGICAAGVFISLQRKSTGAPP
ncbi:MAG: MFS transporter, partial [Clostridiales Family XIII bacterium]|nr:MFS transporter [Clostridiales Family XIII bacterium]